MATTYEIFCERCGTRHVEEQATPAIGARLRGFLRSAPAGGAKAGGRRKSADAQPFLRVCLTCRGYSCAACWNEQAGYCLDCAPVEDTSAEFGSIDASSSGQSADQPGFALDAPSSRGQYVSSGPPSAADWPAADLAELWDRQLPEEAPHPTAPSAAVAPALEVWPTHDATDVEPSEPPELLLSAGAIAEPASPELRDQPLEPAAETPMFAAEDVEALADAPDSDMLDAEASEPDAAEALADAPDSDLLSDGADVPEMPLAELSAILAQFSPAASQVVPEVELEPVAEMLAEPVVKVLAEVLAEVEAEPVVELEPVVEVLAEVEPVVEVLAEVELEPVAEPVAEMLAEAEPEPEPVAEVPADVGPEPVAEPVVEVVAEVEPEAVVEVVAEVEPEAVVEVVAEVEPEPVVEVVAEVEPEPVVEVVAEVEPEPVAEVVAEVEPEPVVEVGPEPVAEPAPIFVPAPPPADVIWPPAGPPSLPPVPPTVPASQPMLAFQPSPVRRRPASSPAYAARRPVVPRPDLVAPSVPQIRDCPNCKLPISVRAHFCRRCGTSQVSA